MNELAEAQLYQYRKVLDHGYVALVDYMGTDESIVQAARVSYGQGTKVVSDDEVLIRYLLNHKHCYHADMQVLTIGGWKKWSDCNKEEEFIVPNTETKELHIEKLSVKTFHCNEELHKFENNRISYMVTENHNMYFKSKYNDNFNIVKAKDMKLWGHFLPINDFKLYNKEITDTKLYNIAKLVGFFLGDGFWSSSIQIGFRLQKERKIKYLEEILTILNIEYNKRESIEDGDVVQNYSLYFPELTNYTNVWGNSSTKELNIKSNISNEEIDGILDGIVNSDGHVKKDRNQIEISSNSVSICNGVQILSALKGIDCHFCKKFDTFRIKMYKGNKTTLESRKQYHTKIPYNGNVYCTTTSTGLLIVRGKDTDFAMICGNSTPFEMVQLKFNIAMPIHCHRQFIRHRMSTTNEYSARYSEVPEVTYQSYNLNLQSKNNKQGRNDDTIDLEEEIWYKAEILQQEKNAFGVYHDLINDGVAKEIARMHLPLNTYTYFYWKIDLHNLFHFLRLRCDSHAQFEIRQYANCLAALVKECYPLAFKAFYDYVYGAVTFSRQDRLMLNWMFSNDYTPESIKPEYGLVRKNFFIECDRLGMSKREANEFLTKLDIPSEQDFSLSNYELIQKE